MKNKEAEATSRALFTIGQVGYRLSIEMEIRRGGLEALGGKFAHYFLKMYMMLYQPHVLGGDVFSKIRTGSIKLN